MSFIVVPVTMFYYEGDSDLTLMQRWTQAFLYEIGVIIFLACVLAVGYSVGGKVEYPLMALESGLAPLADLGNTTALLNNCIVPGSGPTAAKRYYNGRLCDAINGSIPVTTWSQRVSFVIYVIAITATIGWLLFMAFAGIGLVAFPFDLVREFLGRPKSTITRSEYIKRAQGLGGRAKEVKDVGDKLKREEREFGRGRKFRTKLRTLEQQVLLLEEDQEKLEKVFPQGEDPDYMWIITVLMFWVKLAVGILGGIVSILWLAQVVAYIFTYPPLDPFLNTVFTKLDSVFPLFGTLAFAIFCFYLILCTIKGCLKCGLNFLFLPVYPMRPGATLMSAFLFNIGLVLLAVSAAILFCAQAFSLYANSTAIQEIFGNQMLSLQGIKYLYSTHVFIYCMFGFVGLTIVYLAVRGPDRWKRRKLEDVYADG
ncbi:hypothetical protein WJX74_010732 [Apatococcus lobatus]|uniref:LIMR family protein n=2 Tax=Apatococcus TaxID=904362 RepID=A0AAW1T021_9CHLO